ncbi:MAG: tetratricopeptide repeat protein [Planctomycetes bacterium]|nr:tetratricopeptide repeat protein [Planctomycetota bacterium]
MSTEITCPACSWSGSPSANAPELCPKCGARLSASPGPTSAAAAAERSTGGVTPRERTAIRRMLDNDPEFHAALTDLELDVARTRIAAGREEDPLAGLSRERERYRRRGDAAGEARLLQQMAELRLQRGETGDAATLLEEAGALFEERGEVDAAAEALRRASDLCRERLQDAPRANRLDERLLALARGAGNRPLEAFVLGRMAFHLTGQGMHAEALEHLRAGLRVATSVGDLAAVFNLMLLQGVVLVATREVAGALASFESSAQACRAAGDPEALYACYMRAGNALLDGGLPQAAIPFFARARDHAAAYHAGSEELAALLALGFARRAADEPDLAEESFQRARELGMSAGDGDGAFLGTLFLATTRASRRRWPEAEIACREAAALLGHMEEVASVGSAALELAGLMARLGLFHAAIDVYERLGRASRRLRDGAEDVLILTELGATFRDMDDHHRAEESARRVLAATASDAGSFERFLANNNMGLAVRGQGRFTEALSWFARAHEIAAAAGDQVGACTAQLNIGRTHFLAGDLASARRHYEAAARLDLSGRRVESDADYLAWMGDLSEREGDPKAARAFYLRAIEAYETSWYLIRANRVRHSLAKLDSGHAPP